MGLNIAERFLPKNFGDLGKFGDKETIIKFMFKKLKGVQNDVEQFLNFIRSFTIVV